MYEIARLWRAKQPTEFVALVQSSLNCEANSSPLLEILPAMESFVLVFAIVAH